MEPVTRNEFLIITMLILGSIWMGNAFSAPTAGYKITSLLLALFCFVRSIFFIVGRK